MRHFESELEKIAYDEYSDILDKKDEEIEEKSIKTKNNELSVYDD